MKPIALPLFLVLAGPAAAQCVLHDLNPGSQSSAPNHMTPAFDDMLLFSARDPTFGEELFRWTAATGVMLLKDIHVGAGNSTPRDLAYCCSRGAGPRVFFGAQGATGHGLWMTDGTAAGTVLIRDLAPSSLIYGDVNDLTPCDGRVFFVAEDGVNGYELWVTDGTNAGTQMLEVNPGWQAARPEALTAVGDRLFFEAMGPTTGRELYVTDGTPAGTVMVKDIYPGFGHASVDDMGALGDRVYFSAYDGPGSTQALWTSDGTAGGTYMLTNHVSGAHLFVRAGDYLYFRGGDVASGTELWRTDGTVVGTTLVYNAGAFALSGNPEQLTPDGDRLWFTAVDAGSGLGLGRELYVTDGTPAGTQVVNINQAISQSSLPRHIASVGNGVCCGATGANGNELWFSDGTQLGTFEVCDINPGTVSGWPENLVVCGGQLFFVGHTPATGRELYRIARPGASRRQLGAGSSPDWPTLDAISNPVSGAAVVVEANGPAGHLSVLMVGFPTYPVAIPPAFGDGACDWVGVAAAQAHTVLSSVNPSFSASISIPAGTAFHGFGFHLQGFWLDPGSAPLLQASNGLRLTVGGVMP